MRIPLPAPLAASALVPVAVAAAWAAALALGEGLGPAVYLLPLAVAGLLAAGLLAGGMALARPWALTAMLVVVVAGLTVAFSQREEGEVGLTPQNGIKLVVWLVLAGVALLQARRIAPAFRDPLVALAGMHVGIALASTLWSLVPPYTAINALGLVGYLGFACLLAARLPERTVFRVMAGGLLALIGGGLVAGALLPDTAWLPPSHGEPSWRFQGLSGQPNVCAQQAGYLLTLAAAGRRLGHLGRPLFVAAVAVGLAAIVLSNSRTTLLACLLAWGVIALRERGGLAAAALLLLPGVVLALLAVATGQMANIEAMLGGVTRSGSSSELLTLTGRTEIWSVVADLIAERPLFGWGYNGTEQLISDSVPTQFYGSHVNAHNMSLQLVLTLGVLGALPGLGFVLGLLLRMAVAPDAARDQAVLFMVVSGLSEAPIFIMPALQNLVIFYLMARDASAAVEDVAPARTPPRMPEGGRA
ncbi:O-antigen ligase family protein [Methylobacterium oryzihabitans]|uniref:O-antigen ligase family protein n=1 Tax=Methylobacterium oryzihabitans TaxID=2499852 RepID=A0A437P136_9HYPH|nr:O-antigen ligase family protein [Methylobacterium oryzihabitans]RVU15945.1 O-antigen ligase family protein [Methylobacterium oryzihabitans]